MSVVLDASAGIEIVLGRKRAKPIAECITDSDKVISSELYHAEVASALWKYCRGGFIAKEKALRLLDLAIGLVDEYSPIAVNNAEALLEAIRLGHSPYDLLYFTLARRTGSSLLTLDKRLAALAGAEGIETVVDPADCG